MFVGSASLRPLTPCVAPRTVVMCTAICTYENLHTTMTARNALLRPVRFRPGVGGGGGGLYAPPPPSFER